MAQFRKIKSYIAEVDTLSEKLPEDKGSLHSVEEYDEKGHLLNKEVYRGKGKLSDSVRCSYDELGRLVSEEIIHHLENQKQVRELKYDDEKKTISDRTFYETGGDTTTFSVFNDKGQLTVLKKFYGENDLEEEEVFTYDESDRLLLHSVKDPEGNIITEDSYLYYEDKITITKTGDEDIVEVHYLKNKQAWKVEIFKGDDFVSEIERDIDENGQVIGERIKEGGMLIIERVFGYDENGNRVLEESNDHRYKRTQKTMRDFGVDGLLVSEMHFTTMRAGENFRISYEYE